MKDIHANSSGAQTSGTFNNTNHHGFFVSPVEAFIARICLSLDDK